jgi:hypothetical protein
MGWLNQSLRPSLLNPTGGLERVWLKWQRLYQGMSFALESHQMCGMLITQSDATGLEIQKTILRVH